MIAGIVPAGGAGRRMDGADKLALTVDGIPVLDRVLAAARPLCDRLVVVGPTRRTAVAGVEFIVEDDPGGGPVPAIVAGMTAVGACDIVFVVAGDLPLLRTEHLSRLARALAEPPHVDAAAAAHRDSANPLLAAYRGAALRRTAVGLGAGSTARRLLPSNIRTVDLGVATLNVNRPEDLVIAEQLATQPPATFDRSGRINPDVD